MVHRCMLFVLFFKNVNVKSCHFFKGQRNYCNHDKLKKGRRKGKERKQEKKKLPKQCVLLPENNRLQCKNNLGLPTGNTLT